MPTTATAIRHKFDINGHEGYLHVGLLGNGEPGEIFITMAKEGSTVGGMMDAFSTAISLCLQYGVPLEALVKKFSHQRFEPNGMTANPNIPFARSIVDYIFRWLGLEFLEEYRKANSLRRPGRADQPAPTATQGPAAARGVKDDTAPVAHGAGRTAGKDVGGPGAAILTPPHPDGAQHLPQPKPAAGLAEERSSRPPERLALERFDQQFSHFQEGAPACEVCGSIMVRNGNCYKCYNCGSSLGCS
jgi:ribonucleoside-diphosphate reductase alpha chain